MNCLFENLYEGVMLNLHLAVHLIILNYQKNKITQY